MFDLQNMQINDMPLVRMQRKAGMRSNLIVIANAQGAKRLVLRLSETGELEMQLDLEPISFGASKCCKRTMLDHWKLP